jgi:hypothetical protein
MIEFHPRSALFIIPDDMIYQLNLDIINLLTQGIYGVDVKRHFTRWRGAVLPDMSPSGTYRMAREMWNLLRVCQANREMIINLTIVIRLAWPLCGIGRTLIAPS